MGSGLLTCLRLLTLSSWKGSPLVGEIRSLGSKVKHQLPGRPPAPQSRTRSRNLSHRKLPSPKQPGNSPNPRSRQPRETLRLVWRSHLRAAPPTLPRLPPVQTELFSQRNCNRKKLERGSDFRRRDNPSSSPHSAFPSPPAQARETRLGSSPCPYFYLPGCRPEQPRRQQPFLPGVWHAVTP